MRGKAAAAKAGKAALFPEKVAPHRRKNGRVPRADPTGTPKGKRPCPREFPAYRTLRILYHTKVNDSNIQYGQKALCSFRHIAGRTGCPRQRTPLTGTCKKTRCRGRSAPPGKYRDAADGERGRRKRQRTPLTGTCKKTRCRGRSAPPVKHRDAADGKRGGRKRQRTPITGIGKKRPSPQTFDPVAADGDRRQKTGMICTVPAFCDCISHGCFRLL